MKIHKTSLWLCGENLFFFFPDWIWCLLVNISASNRFSVFEVYVSFGSFNWQKPFGSFAGNRQAAHQGLWLSSRAAVRTFAASAFSVSSANISRLIAVAPFFNCIISRIISLSDRPKLVLCTLHRPYLLIQKTAVAKLPVADNTPNRVTMCSSTQTEGQKCH